MKWRIHLTYIVTVSTQMVVLLLAWWLKVLADNSGPILTALAVVAVGIAGGIVIAHIKSGAHSENSAIFLWVNVIGSVITTVGVFLVFIPIMGLLFHSTATAIIFWFGFLAPLFTPYIVNRIGVTNKA